MARTHLFPGEEPIIVSRQHIVGFIPELFSGVVLGIIAVGIAVLIPQNIIVAGVNVGSIIRILMLLVEVLGSTPLNPRILELLLGPECLLSHRA